MKNQRQFQALLVTIITLLFLAPLAIAGTIETYIFINKQQDIEDYRSPQKLVELLEWRRTKFADDTRFADEELEEQSLPQGDETHLVIVYLALGWQIIALKLELCLELIPFEFSQRTSSLDEDYPFFLEKRLLQ